MLAENEGRLKIDMIEGNCEWRHGENVEMINFAIRNIYMCESQKDLQQEI